MQAGLGGGGGRSLMRSNGEMQGLGGTGGDTIATICRENGVNTVKR